jgi:hypothetical protein
MEGSGGYWFKSSLFAAEPGEDEATNPRLYGRQLANWLRERILSLGYPAVEVIAEDWGWCVMCQREPYELWIGCVNLADYEYAKPGDPPPPKERLLWKAMTTAERPIFKYLFRRKPEMREGAAPQRSASRAGHRDRRRVGRKHMVRGSAQGSQRRRC